LGEKLVFCLNSLFLRLPPDISTMLIKEYRIIMPMSTEEYRVAQLYMVAKFSREKSSEGEGIQVLKNEPYQDGNSSGQFTHKKIYLGSSLPSWARSWIPESFCVEEKAWNAYPYVKNVYSCPAFGERFSIVTETRYLDNDDGQQENVFMRLLNSLSLCDYVFFSCRCIISLQNY